MQAFPAQAIKSHILVLRKLSSKLASSDISVRLCQMQWQGWGRNIRSALQHVLCYHCMYEQHGSTSKGTNTWPKKKKGLLWPSAMQMFPSCRRITQLWYVLNIFFSRPMAALSGSALHILWFRKSPSSKPIANADVGQASLSKQHSETPKGGKPLPFWGLVLDLSLLFKKILWLMSKLKSQWHRRNFLASIFL